MPRPLPPNTSLSVVSTGAVTHNATGNPCTVYSDYAIWCEALGSFVLPEDTNLMKADDE